MLETGEIAKLRTALAAETAHADTQSAGAEAANSALLQTRATARFSEALIKELKLEIAKLRRDKYGVSSERSARLLDQLELQLEELEAAATEMCWRLSRPRPMLTAQCAVSPAASQHASPSPTICRANALWSRRPPNAPAAGRIGS